LQITYYPKTYTGKLHILQSVLDLMAASTDSVPLPYCMHNTQDLFMGIEDLSIYCLQSLSTGHVSLVGSLRLLTAGQK
jgi:hypothetical protein